MDTICTKHASILFGQFWIPYVSSTGPNDHVSKKIVRSISNPFQRRVRSFMTPNEAREDL